MILSSPLFFLMFLLDKKKKKFKKKILQYLVEPIHKFEVHFFQGIQVQNECFQFFLLDCLDLNENELIVLLKFPTNDIN